MLNEIERVLASGGFLFVADLRRSWAGLFERGIKSALTLEEARDLFGQSNLREGVFSWGYLHIPPKKYISGIKQSDCTS